MQKKDYFDKFTIVIQGRFPQEEPEFEECVTRQIEEYGPKCAKLIYSLWEDDSQNISKVEKIIKKKSDEISKKIEIIATQKPPNCGCQNYFYQLVSTCEGLKRVETEFAIKTRADEYFSNIDNIMFLTLQEPEKLHVSPIFFRPYEYYSKYHISDHIISSKTENLKMTFFTALEENFKSIYNIEGAINAPDTCEENLTRNFLMKKFGECSISTMKSGCRIFSLEPLKPYRVRANCYSTTFHSNFDPKAWESVENIEDFAKDVVQ